MNKIQKWLYAKNEARDLAPMFNEANDIFVDIDGKFGFNIRKCTQEKAIKIAKWILEITTEQEQGDDSQDGEGD